VVPARVHLAAPGLALEIRGGDLRLDRIDLATQLIDRGAAGWSARRQVGLAGRRTGD
jgi:hypothetical protein